MFKTMDGQFDAARANAGKNCMILFEKDRFDSLPEVMIVWGNCCFYYCNHFQIPSGEIVQVLILNQKKFYQRIGQTLS